MLVPVVRVDTSLLISESSLNQLIGNLRAISQRLLIICTVLDSPLPFLNSFTIRSRV